MKITIKTGTGDLTPSIKNFIETKLGSLGKYIKKFDESSSAELRVEIERTTKHHRKGDVWRAVADLSIPGQMLRAEKWASDIRTAIDIVKDTLRLEIEKHLESKSVRNGRSVVRRARGK